VFVASERSVDLHHTYRVADVYSNNIEYLKPLDSHKSLRVNEKKMVKLKIYFHYLFFLFIHSNRSRIKEEACLKMILNNKSKRQTRVIAIYLMTK